MTTAWSASAQHLVLDREIRLQEADEFRARSLGKIRHGKLVVDVSIQAFRMGGRVAGASTATAGPPHAGGGLGAQRRNQWGLGKDLEERGLAGELIQNSGQLDLPVRGSNTLPIWICDV